MSNAKTSISRRFLAALLSFVLVLGLGQFTRNYTQTTKRGLLTTNKG